MSRNSVLLIAAGALLFPVIWIEASVLMHTHGTLAYPLDDTFIHMAVAKNLAFEKVWGVSKYSFQSASSSPLYTVLLAAIFLTTGAHSITPLLINMIAAVCFLFVLQRWLERQQLSTTNQLIVLVLVILLTPLPLLVISGMEHTLQLLFCFLFIWSFSEAAVAKTGRLPWTVYVYGLLLVTTRYECMFIVGLASLLLLLQKHWWTAIKLGVISLLPITLFGLFALSRGSYFMPNSVLIKSGTPPLTLDGLIAFFADTLWYKIFFVNKDYNLLSAQRLLLLLPMIYLLFQDTLRRRTTYRYILIILMGAAIPHVAFAYYSPFPRYEAYLVGCSVIIGSVIILQSKPGLAVWLKGKEWLFYPSLAVLALPLIFRCTTAYGNSAQSCINIYDQQYQMAQFVHHYYNTSGIAFNDIGAVSYYSEGDKLDLVGIASLEVVKSKKLGYWSPAFIDHLSRRQNIQLAILYDRWFPRGFFHNWKKVASWRIQNNVIAGDDSVSFFAVDTANIKPLIQHLHEYEKGLPDGVKVRYY